MSAIHFLVKYQEQEWTTCNVIFIRFLCRTGEWSLVRSVCFSSCEIRLLLYWLSRTFTGVSPRKEDCRNYDLNMLFIRLGPCEKEFIRSWSVFEVNRLSQRQARLIPFFLDVPRSGDWINILQTWSRCNFYLGFCGCRSMHVCLCWRCIHNWLIYVWFTFVKDTFTFDLKLGFIIQWYMSLHGFGFVRVHFVVCTRRDCHKCTTPRSRGNYAPLFLRFILLNLPNNRRGYVYWVSLDRAKQRWSDHNLFDSSAF